MISDLIWILKTIREELLEKFMLPELNISYWDFCIYLAMAAIVITVLINSVKVSGSGLSNVKSEKAYRNTLRERERVKHDERQKLYGKKDSSSFGISNSSIDAWQSRVESEDI